MKSLVMFFALVVAGLQANAQPCDLVCPSNMIVSAEKNSEGATVRFPNATASSGCGNIVFTPASGSFFRLGSHSIIVTSSTGQKCSFTVTVTDNEPPVLSEVKLSPARLWPASNKMKKVNLEYKGSDNGQEYQTIIVISSNDPAASSSDWRINNNRQVELRASRMANGEPRIYTIEVTLKDTAGNTTTRTTSIAVSKTMLPLPVVTTE